MDGEIPMLEFIYDDVRRLDGRAPVLGPSFRIGILPVDHRTTHSVHSHSLCCDSGRLFQPFSILLHPESIEGPLEILVDHCLPKSALGLLHVDCPECSVV